MQILLKTLYFADGKGAKNVKKVESKICPRLSQNLSKVESRICPSMLRNTIGQIFDSING